MHFVMRDVKEEPTIGKKRRRVIEPMCESHLSLHRAYITSPWLNNVLMGASSKEFKCLFIRALGLEETQAVDSLRRK